VTDDELDRIEAVAVRDYTEADDALRMVAYTAIPALVAEVRRLRAATRQAVLAEREACARLAQFTLPAWAPPADPPQKRIADAIRERATP
jgi:hypothetical protein